MFQLDDHELDLLVEFLEFLDLLARFLLAVVVKPEHGTSFRDAFLGPHTNLHLPDVLFVLHIEPQPRLPELPPMDLHLGRNLNKPLLIHDLILDKDLGLLVEQFLERDITLGEQLLLDDDDLLALGLWGGLYGFGVLDEQDLEVRVVEFVEEDLHVDGGHLLALKFTPEQVVAFF